ncbi:MAG: metal ABC transporter permease [Pseudomonadota bacterium]
MIDFLYSLFEYEFLQNALLAGILASISCGLTGPFVVVNRISYLAGGIAHAVLGGMGAAIYFQIDPIIGALVSALLSALLISYIKLKFEQQEDTVIGALWSVGMATGIIFISQTPGYNSELLSYLFGNILMVSEAQLQMMFILDVLLVLIITLFYKYFVAISFDREFAKTLGIPVNFFYTLLLCLVALTVVILIQVVGLILVIALLTLPAAIASHYSFSIIRIMMFAIIGGFIFTSSGLMVSYQADFPAGSVIIVIAGTTFLISTFMKGFILSWVRKIKNSG